MDSRPQLRFEIREPQTRYGVERVRLYGVVWIAPSDKDDLAAFKLLVEQLDSNLIAAACTNTFDCVLPMGELGGKDVRARARELLIQLASSGMPHP